MGGETFGWAIKQLKNGSRVCREGWNGKGMWLKLITPGDYSINGHVLTAPAITTIGPWIGIRSVSGQFLPWVASQSDVLSEDWYVSDNLEIEK